MREQERKFKAMNAEYKKLKKELFRGKTFVIPDPKDKKKWERYNQIQAFFYPQFRYEGWKNPLDEDKK
jgi:hypothetical protein